MSTATEIARAEADEAEQLEGAEEEEGTDNGEPDPEPEPEAQTVDAVKVKKETDKERARHTAAVEKIAGADFELYAACPCCGDGVQGFVLPFQALPAEAQSDIRAGVEAWTAQEGLTLEDFEPAADMDTCDVCKGRGMVRSGSTNPDHVLEQCSPCLGNGWKRKSIDQPAAASSAPYVQASTPAGEAPYRDAHGNPTWASPDQFGRPFGDPSYGLTVAPPLAAVPPVSA